MNLRNLLKREVIDTKTKKIACIGCDRKLEILSIDDKIIPLDSSRLSINMPGIICPDCVDEILTGLPDPPGLICVKELSEEMTKNLLVQGGFILDFNIAVHSLIDFFPTRADIYDVAAVKLHQEGYPEEAYDVLEKGIKSCDNPDLLRLEAATMTGIDGSPELGLEMLSEITNPDLQRFWVIKGNLLRKLGRWEEASKCWEHEMNKNPNDFFAWNNLGYYLLHIKKDFKKAQKHYENACDNFPDESRFHAYLGDSLFSQNHVNEALKNYYKALSIEGEDSEFAEQIKNMIDACNNKQIP
jgi:tetratricopeptide (TPR) repeat protein